jgi:tetratricopeptide (TPR) repeat protein
MTLAAAVLLLPMIGRADTLDDAHRAFAGGQYAAATAGYQAVLEKNGYSAPVLFDLGNSYYREGDLAQAILAYERAQWLAPSDPDIAANLRQAQKQAGISASEPGWSEKITGVLNASEWAWIACGAWTVIWLSRLARWLWSSRRGLFFATSAAGVLVLIAAIAAVWVSSGELRRAVVVDKNAAVLISPFPAAQAVFSPTPGEVVSVQKSYDDYLLVADEGGRSGWIAKGQIEAVIPGKSG